MEILPLRLVANSQVTRVWENGREYLVAPATSLREQVLSGSRGPLYYPAEETVKSVSSWDGQPLVVYHPTHNGEDISAHDERADIKAFIGEIRGSRHVGNGKLQHKLWFDIENTRNADRNLSPSVQILPRLLNGRPVALSTGLYTDNEPAQNGSHYNGVPYVGIARNYRPDHIAILPDVRAACDISDGCGVLVNSKDGQPSDSADVSSEKACTILKDGEVRGHPLTEAQRGMFGAICGEGRSGTKNTSGGIETLREVLGRYTDQQLDGLAVRANPDLGICIVDRMDWYDKSADGADPATEVEDAAAKLWGKERVISQNEGPLPNGNGWIVLNRTHDTFSVSSANKVIEAGRWLAKNGLMPGYGEIYLKGSTAWYVGGDGDERGFDKLVEKRLTSIPGINEVIYEAESYPPEDEGWAQVFSPKRSDWADSTTNGAECSCGGTCDDCQAKEIIRNAVEGQPRCSDRGVYQSPKSGTDRGNVAHHVKKGHSTLDDERVDRTASATFTLNSFFLTNAELGHGSRFTSDTERVYAFASLLPDSDSIAMNEFESDDQQRAFFGLLKQAEAGKGKRPEGSKVAGGGDLKESADAKSVEAVKRSGIAKKVNKDRQAREHGKAAEAHREAAKAHDEAGDKSKADSHRKISLEHESRARAITGNRRMEPPMATKVNNGSKFGCERDCAGDDDEEGCVEECMTDNQRTEDDRRAAMPYVRETTLAALTANCRCEEDVSVLNGLSDETLQTLVSNASTLPIAKKGPPPVNPDDLAAEEELELKEGELAEAPVVPVVPKKKVTMVMNHHQETSPMTYNEWLAMAPAEAQETHRWASGIVEREKRVIANKLTAHVTDKARRATLVKNLMTKSMDELVERLELVPPPVANSRGRAQVDPQDISPVMANYLGAAGAPATNQLSLTDNEAGDILDLEASRQKYDPMIVNRRQGRDQVREAAAS